MAPAAAARPESESKTRQDAEDTRWLQTLSEPELVRRSFFLASFPPILSNATSIDCSSSSLMANQSKDFPSHQSFWGLLIGLKEVAVTRASSAGHPDLADKVFHVRALRALAFVLLEELKERLRQASVNTSMLEKLALQNDHDPEDVMPMPNGINKKRKQMQDGCDGEDAQSPKRRKATREEDWFIAGAAKPLGHLTK